MNKTRFSVVGSGYYIKMFDKHHPIYLALNGMGANAIHKVITDPSAFAMLGFGNERDSLGYI